jgi:hypothetical protein
LRDVLRAEIGQLFAQAVSKSVPDDDPRAHAFTMHYDPNFGIAGSVEARPDAHRRVWGGTTDQWCGLYLKYAMRFPIDLLVSPDVLRRYNELFKFLFSVKRAEISLHIAWTKLMSSRRLQLYVLRAHCTGELSCGACLRVVCVCVCVCVCVFACVCCMFVHAHTCVRACACVDMRV